MQELRLVAVSEDGTYLVLATIGRGTRFTLPVDDRLRAAVRGNFSRLGQYEIEVESPLRPKEIQARIRSGETAEEIAATAGIPVERVRWFEGPVLQEREYVAQQAQRIAVRLPGGSGPGPALGDIVSERLSQRGVPSDEIDWDSRKKEDGTWRVRLGFIVNGVPRHAEWLFDPRRRHVAPADDEATRLCSDEADLPFDSFDEEPEHDTVTPFVPRLAPKLQPVPAPVDEVDEVQEIQEAVEEPNAAEYEEPAIAQATEPSPDPAPAPQAPPAPARERPAAQVPPSPAAFAGKIKMNKPGKAAAKPSPKPAPKPAPKAAPKPVPKAAPKTAPAAAQAASPAPAADAEPNGARPARKATGGRNRRASVPTWDEIMFGARRQD